jgi:hypothetical protein
MGRSDGGRLGSSGGGAEPDEYVEIRNAGSAAVELAGWTLSDKSGRAFSFPGVRRAARTGLPGVYERGASRVVRLQLW